MVRSSVGFGKLRLDIAAADRCMRCGGMGRGIVMEMKADMDGVLQRFDLRLDRRPLALADHVLRDVPAAWDPAAIARFVRKINSSASQ